MIITTSQSDRLGRSLNVWIAVCIICAVVASQVVLGEAGSLLQRVGRIS